MSGKAIRETLTALGVIASMVFVGLEIRQNNRLAEAAAYQELGIATQQNWVAATLNPEVNHLMWDSRRAGADTAWYDRLDQSALDQLASLEIANLRGYEAVYQQVQLGLLDQRALESMGWTNVLTDGPPYLWPQIRSSIDPYLRDYLEEGWGMAP